MPLKIASLPPNLQRTLKNADQSLAPTLTIKDVRSRILKAKKPNGIVPGDVPKKLVKFCGSTLAIYTS